jgi:hypothetical protein
VPCVAVRAILKFAWKGYSVDAVMVGRLRTVFSSSCFECTERYDQQTDQQTMEQLRCGVGPSTASSKPDFTVCVNGLVVLVAEFKNNVTLKRRQCAVMWCWDSIALEWMWKIVVAMCCSATGICFSMRW